MKDHSSKGCTPQLAKFVDYLSIMPSAVAKASILNRNRNASYSFTKTNEDLFQIYRRAQFIRLQSLYAGEPDIIKLLKYRILTRIHI